MAHRIRWAPAAVASFLFCAGCSARGDVEREGETLGESAAALDSPPDLFLEPYLSSLLPRVIRPGDSIGVYVHFLAHNASGATAPGTVGALDPSHGFMMDVVLSTDTVVPAGYAIYSPHYSEDVLLRGGRASRTDDLAAGRWAEYGIGCSECGTIPLDTPPGDYQVCVQIDPGQKVVESNESNNVACLPLRISPR